MKSTFEFNQVKVSVKDILCSEVIFAHEFNPHNIHPILVTEHGFISFIVFAEHLQDALDILADEGKLDTFQIEEKDFEDYGINTDNPTCTFLGNASEPFDIENLSAFDLNIADFPVELQLRIMEAKTNGTELE